MGLECLSNVKRKDKILGNTSFRGWEEKGSPALKTEKERPDRSEENMEEVVGAKDEGAMQGVAESTLYAIRLLPDWELGRDMLRNLTIRTF